MPFVQRQTNAETGSAARLFHQSALDAARAVNALHISWELISGRPLKAAVSSHKTKHNKKLHHILHYHRTFLVRHTLSSWALRLLLHISTPQPFGVILQPGDTLCTAPPSLDCNKGIHLPSTISLFFISCEQGDFTLTCLQPSWVRAPFLFAWLGWVCLVWVSLPTKLLASCFIVRLKLYFFHASKSSCQHKAILSISLLCTCPCKLSAEQFMLMI